LGRLTRGEGQLTIFLTDHHVLVNSHRQCALAAFGGQLVGIDFNLNAGRHFNRIFRYAGYSSLLEYGADDFATDACLARGTI
ncbi:hypothetical protein SB776_39820, partial [Burkholderia sp. SIMBA_045]